MVQFLNPDRIDELQSEIAFLEEEIYELRKALSFAACCIKSGESWTETCEEIIGKLLRQEKPEC